MNGATVTEHATLPTLLSVARLRRIGLSFTSAGLLICSLPSPDIGWLAWIALVPLLLACHGLRPLRAGGIGFVHGFVAAFGIYNWMFQLPAFGWRHAFVLAAYLALYPMLFCFALAVFNRWRAPLLLTAPALWTLVEYLRANAGFLALPWATLAHTQHENLAILQFASFAGEHGVTFLVALGNAAIAQMFVSLGIFTTEAQRTQSSGSDSDSDFLRKHILRTLRPQRLRGEFSVFDPKTIIGVSIIALAHTWGAWVLYSEPTGPTLRVAAIQPNIQIAERESKEGPAKSFERLIQLTKTAAVSRPELIVWPESAVAGNLHTDRAMNAALQSLARDIGVPIVVGAAEVQKFSTGERQTTFRSEVFNSAYLLQPDVGLSEPYRKRRLLPFGEYVPHETFITWPEWLAPKVSEMTPGETAHLFPLSNGVKIGALICWENLFAPLARESVAAGAQILVQLTNDVWFGNTAAPHQHNLASVLRAVENRVPIVIASNTGPSQIIDAHGRIVASARRMFGEDAVGGEITPGSHRTIYTRFGDAFVFVLMGSGVLTVLRRPVLVAVGTIFKSHSGRYF